jgi:pimeloyl-ACP methyl ester carboxylesterase
VGEVAPASTIRALEDPVQVVVQDFGGRLRTAPADATFAPKALRPRLARLLEQPVLIVPELRSMIRLGVRAYRIRRPAPLPLSDAQLSTVRTPLHPVLGKRSLLAHPQRQVERVPRMVPGARAEIVSSAGHGPQIDHADEVNRRRLDFMDTVE